MKPRPSCSRRAIPAENRVLNRPFFTPGREVVSASSLNKFQEIQILCPNDARRQPRAVFLVTFSWRRPRSPDGLCSTQREAAGWGSGAGTGKRPLCRCTENSRTFNPPPEPRGPECDGGRMSSRVRFTQLSAAAY